MGMLGDTTAAGTTIDETARMLHAISSMLMSVELDDSGQALRDLRRMANLLVRVAERARVRLRTGPARPPRLPSRTALGPRENAIAHLLAEGKAYKDIAVQLDMGLSSVATRVKTVYLKLGVHSRLELQQRMLASPISASSSADDGDADSDGASRWR
jgi:DNA-binding NarL/FixJ family response regulator